MTDFVTIERDDLPEEPDRLAGHPHPRETLFLAGHSDAEQTLLDLYRSGRMPQGWIFAGPEGIGKATLAYRLARFMLSNPDPSNADVKQAISLHVAADHPVTGQVARLSHGDLGIMRRTIGKTGSTLRTAITAGDVRDGLDLFRVTASAGGWRVIIVDAADEMNREASNALLKMLEEPPERAIFILIAHQPGRMLTTIRSRCRMLRLSALSDGDLSAALRRFDLPDRETSPMDIANAEGSLRRALVLTNPDIAALVKHVQSLLDRPEGTDPTKWLQFADKLTGKPATEKFQFAVEMIERHVHTLATARAGEPGLQSKVSACLTLWEKLRKSVQETETYTLDRRPVLMMALAALVDIQREDKSAA